MLLSATLVCRTERNEANPRYHDLAFILLLAHPFLVCVPRSFTLVSNTRAQPHTVSVSVLFYLVPRHVAFQVPK